MEYLPKWPGVHDGETASTGRVFHASSSSGVFTGRFYLGGKLEVDRSGEPVDWQKAVPQRSLVKEVG